MIGQFTVYKNEDRNTRKIYPYFLNVQNDLLNDFNSRVVIPFSTTTSTINNSVKKLCPIIVIEGQDFVLLTHQITAVPAALLKNPVTEFSSFRSEIISAIDLLITGI